MDGNNHDLTKADFQKMIDNDGQEFKVCMKLTQQVIDVSGQERQRVRPAARLLSHTVGKGILHHFGDAYKPQSDAVLCINSWFDTMNSRTKYTAVPERCGFGVNEELQQKALSDMEEFVLNMDFCSFKKRRRKKFTIPFQKGIIVSIKSTRELFSEVKAAGVDYLLMSKVNNDPIENYFSRVRGIGGDNTHPGPATAVYRMRILLLGKDPEHIVQNPAVMHMPSESEQHVTATNSEAGDYVHRGDLEADCEDDEHISKELTQDVPRVPDETVDQDLLEIDAEKVGLISFQYI